MADEKEDFIVTLADARRAGHCALGIRRWCIEKGIDFRDFQANGLSAAWLRELGDGHADQIVRRAEKRRARRER